MRVALVGPNHFERRKSMALFVECLVRELPGLGVEPVEFVPRFPNLGRCGENRIMKVCLRLVVEAGQLRRLAREVDLVHVCDHASAFLLEQIGRRTPTLVTCHDVGFIATAMAIDSRVSRADRWWQRRILSGIVQARTVACVSATTEGALQAVARTAGLPTPQTAIVLNGLYQPFVAWSAAELARRLKAIAPGLEPGRYVLSVGSNFPRKNRRAVLPVFAGFGPAHGMRLALAGEPLNDALRAEIGSLGLSNCVDEVSDPSAEILGVLYQGAFALVFPSHEEGFGLPPIEAQTLGCPVVCSGIPVHRANLGATALFSGANDTPAMIGQLQILRDPGIRADIIARGLANSRRFTTAAMIEAYSRVYTKLAGMPRPSRPHMLRTTRFPQPARSSS